jgi:diaminopimelate epimerase
LSLEFAKLHSLGNDFLIVRTGEPGDLPSPLGALAVGLCDRHRGVGADGVVFYQPTISDSEAETAAIIINADGSRAEVSGNGLRCLAAHLNATGAHPGETLRIRTVVGIRTYSLKDVRNGVYTYESRMGRPILDPSLVPAQLGGSPGPVLDYPLVTSTGVIPVSVCSLGNPHCSTFWPDLSQVPVEAIGPAIEHHQAFPRRTNVEFVQVLDGHSLRVRFWERGVGLTMSSGTGVSAATVAAILHGFVESPVNVYTESGSMSVAWRPGEDLFLVGPAEFICRGSYLPASNVPESA